MNLTETVRAVGRDVSQLAGEASWAGRYYFDSGRTALWVQFEDDGLVSLFTTKDTGFKSGWMSPKRNLCTGEDFYRLLVVAPPHLKGAEVYLDGAKVAVIDPLLTAWVEMPNGPHEVTVRKEGHEIVTVEIPNAPGDPGNPELVITGLNTFSIE